MTRLLPSAARLIVVLVALAASAAPAGALAADATATAGRTGLANPASTNCADKGGTLTIEKNGRGDQFGVCTFPDNLQCEEWAMMRGDCRTGGIKVTGFVTPAARYCAITGGAYAVTSASNTPDERGTCTFNGGKTCAAAAYFAGTCTRTAGKAARAAVTTTTIQARFACSDGKHVDATFVNGASSLVELTLSDGRALSLPQARSASGARYASADEKLVFWNKGNTAFLEENGKATYGNCATRR